jgi:hypothetical protein
MNLTYPKPGDIFYKKAEELSPQFVILNTDDSKNIGQFERSFFDSFVNIDNKLIHQIWDWDFSEKRLKTRITYHNQIIYALLNSTQEVIASIAVNVDPTQNQFGEFGFQLPLETEQYCEVLTLFIHPQASLSAFQLSNFVTLCTTDSASRGFNKTYATCGKRLLRLYQRLGCERLDHKVIDGENRYLICLSY